MTFGSSAHYKNSVCNQNPAYAGFCVTILLMRITFTHIILVVIAVLLSVIAFQLLKKPAAPQPSPASSEAAQKISELQQALAAPDVPIARTRTKDFSFVSWSAYTDTVSKDPLTFSLYEKSKDDPNIESVTYFPKISGHIPGDVDYLNIGNFRFGNNEYSLYENKKTKTRVFVLSNKDGKGVTITTSDAKALVPHYVDLSSVTFLTTESKK